MGLNPGVLWDCSSLKGQWLVLYYLNMLHESIVPAVCQLYRDEDMWYHQDGAPSCYHYDVRAYLDNTFPNQWIGCRGSVEYPPWSPDL